MKSSRTEDRQTGMENMKEKLKEAIHLIGLEGKKRDKEKRDAETRGESVPKQMKRTRLQSERRKCSQANEMKSLQSERARRRPNRMDVNS